MSDGVWTQLSMIIPEHWDSDDAYPAPLFIDEIADIFGTIALSGLENR